jgi:hypothetical protein
MHVIQCIHSNEKLIRTKSTHFFHNFIVMGSAKQTQSPKCNICVQAFVITSWDAHGSYECYNEERGKKSSCACMMIPSVWSNLYSKQICCFNFSNQIIDLFQFFIELLFQFSYWIVISNFMIIFNCYCFKFSLNWCFNSHDRIHLLFQFSQQKHTHN